MIFEDNKETAKDFLVSNKNKQKPKKAITNQAIRRKQSTPRASPHSLSDGGILPGHYNIPSHDLIKNDHASVFHHPLLPAH